MSPNVVAKPVVLGQGFLAAELVEASQNLAHPVVVMCE